MFKGEGEANLHDYSPMVESLPVPQSENIRTKASLDTRFASLFGNSLHKAGVNSTIVKKDPQARIETLSSYLSSDTVVKIFSDLRSHENASSKGCLQSFLESLNTKSQGAAAIWIETIQSVELGSDLEKDDWNEMNSFKKKLCLNSEYSNKYSGSSAKLIAPQRAEIGDIDDLQSEIVLTDEIFFTEQLSPIHHKNPVK